jgi:chemotaxis protein histidine kinase CheA
MLEQFAAETQQHLDEIEPILLQAEWAPLDKAAIAALFRGFHSIKGLARVLGLRGLETLAHHAESLLAEVRSERKPLNAEFQTLLLDALDGIRSLREQGIVGGVDAPAPRALIAALDAAIRAGAQDGTTSAAAPSAPSAVEGMLHDDMPTLIYFAEMLGECLPNLAVLVGGEGDSDQAEDDLESLIIAVERLQLNGLRADLQRLGDASRAEVADCLAAVLAKARRFGRLIDCDVKAEPALDAAAEALGARRQTLARQLLEAMRGGAAGAAEAAGIARRLIALAAAGLADGGIAVLAHQALDDPALLEPALAAVSLLASPLEGDGTDLMALAAERLRDALAGPRTLAPALAKLLEERGVVPARLGQIDASTIAQLATILEGGRRQLLGVTVSLPATADRAELLSWLARRLLPVSSQVVSLLDIDAAALLAVGTEDPVALRAEILAAFPDLVLIEVKTLSDQTADHPWATPRAQGNASVIVPVDNQVRVPVEILDRLFGRIGEFFSISSALNVLMVDSQVPAVLHRLAEHVVSKAPALLPSIDILQRQQSDLAQVEAEVHRLVSLIHEATLGLRVIPLDIVFNRFPRMIREFAKAQGKQIRFEARAEGIKVDKGMTELLADPLMHMLRNAVDHGIEPPEVRAVAHKPPVASIRLSAVQHGNRIIVEIRDDGRGIDGERVRRRAVAQGLVTESDSLRLSKDQIHRFIFTPGFSTAETATETSGRGVGMDVALINVSRLGGRIDIQTVPGQGTTFRLDMPLSAAMQTVLLAETTMQTVAFPERMVVEASTVTRDAVQYVNGQRAILLHDRFLPLFVLTDLLKLPIRPEERQSRDLPVIVVTSGRFRYGVEVSRILRRHEMLIRETHPRIAQLPGIGGVSTLGTDRIVLVVDPEGLTELALGAVVPGMRSAPHAAE